MSQIAMNGSEKFELGRGLNTFGNYFHSKFMAYLNCLLDDYAIAAAQVHVLDERAVNLDLCCRDIA